MLLALPALAESQARIVRLSDVQGSVQIDKNTGLGFESAFLNLPITQGSRVRTRSNGRAEVEFEDGSSLRLTPNSEIEFSTLGRSESGNQISVVSVVEGMAYVNWLGKDDFSLNFGHEKIALDHPAHFRIDATPEVSSLAVFKGKVEVEGPSGKVTVEKKKTATFDAEDKSTVAGNIVEAPFDSWDKEATSYHDQYARNNSSPYGYGVADLNYYGSYTNVPGYGMMWQPYFTGIGWDPFMDGAWGWYPGMGYMFASAYPWGWMPYRYGNWNFIPGFGWMWQPGGWNTWQITPRFTPTALTHVTPLVPPATGTIKTVVVGKGGPTSGLASSVMMVHAGTAGLGIARGAVNNMSHLNREVVKTGFATVRPAPQFSATSPSGRASGSGFAEPRSSMASAPMGRSSSTGSHSSGGGSHH